MDFRKYFYALDKAERITFASKCNTSVGYLLLVSNSKRGFSADLSIAIERESQGKVRCEDLRPSTDWAYIRGTKTA